jgi:hypothetical protein
VGVAPSNFGSALGYNAISVDASATSLMWVADSRSRVGTSQGGTRRDD